MKKNLVAKDLAKLSPMLMRRSYGFERYECDESQLIDRFEKIRPKVGWMLREGVVEPDSRLVFRNSLGPNGGFDSIRLLGPRKRELAGLCPDRRLGRAVPSVNFWYHTWDEGGERQTVVHEFKNWQALRARFLEDHEFSAEMRQAFRAADRDEG